MAQEIRSSVITTSLLKKYKNKPIQSSVALRACFYRSIVSCSETPRATFHLFFSRGCLLLQLLLLCHPKPLKGEVAFSDRKSTRLNSSHVRISYAVFCLKKKRPAV